MPESCCWGGGNLRAEFTYYDLHGNTIAITPSDSLIVIAFKPGGLSGGRTPQQFAAMVPGLDEFYTVWEWSEDFYVYGIDPAMSFDSAFAGVSARDEVGLVNPVAFEEPDYLAWMTDGMIVRFHASVSQVQIDSLNTAHGLTVGYEHPYLVNQFVLIAPHNQGTDLLSLCRTYYETGLCVFAEPNWMSEARPNALPNDPRVAYQWYLENDGSAGGVDADIDADSAWMVTAKTNNVIIAILDSGLDFDHEDLAGIDTVYCYDAAQYVPKNGNPPTTDYDPTFECGGSPSYWDVCWHGTAVTGMIFARTNNNVGIAALSPDCKLMVVKIWDYKNFNRTDVIEDAIYHTFRNPAARADVVSCSWSHVLSAAVEAALDSAKANGVVFVFASGNHGLVEYPARLPSVLAIGATNAWDIVYEWSSQGAALDACAPGGSIWSTDLTGSLPVNPELDPCDGNQDYYCEHWGTSFAAPLAAGTLGRVLQSRPDLAGNVDTLRSILLNSTEDLGPLGFDTQYGHGRVNTYRALLAVTRGDLSNDGELDSVDLSILIDMVFYGGHALLDDRTGDCNCDGFADSLDLPVLIDHIFFGGPRPVVCFDY